MMLSPGRSAARRRHRFSRACARRHAIRYCSRCRWRVSRSRRCAGRVFWQPVVDGVEIPGQPRTLFETGAFHRVPTIIGTNRDEGWVFVTRSFPSTVSPAQYEGWVATEFGGNAASVLAAYPASNFPSPMDAMARVVGDGQFVGEALRLAGLISKTGTPTFLYSYEYEIDDIAPDRVIHGVESNIIFGNNYVPNMFPNHPLDAADLTLHAAMAGYWTRFAATGNPNSTDLGAVHWPAFTYPSNSLMVFGSPTNNDNRAPGNAYDFWEPYFLGTMMGGVTAAHPTVTGITFGPGTVRAGGNFSVRFSGSNLTDKTYFDVRFRRPGSTFDEVALDWQQGTLAVHTAPGSSALGGWIVTGVRPHQDASDHGGAFIPVSATLTVTVWPF